MPRAGSADPTEGSDGADPCGALLVVVELTYSMMAFACALRVLMFWYSSSTRLYSALSSGTDASHAEVCTSTALS